jgi:sphingomyelin phosphodiesterase acid-like 3
MYFTVAKLLISIVCFFISSGLLANTTPTYQKFISVSDIHFDPFLTCDGKPKPCQLINDLRTANYQDWQKIFEEEGSKTLSKVGQDTNYPLLASAMAALSNSQKKEHPQFVLVLGDFLAHRYRWHYRQYSGDKSQAGYESFVKKTLQFLTQQIKQVFPNTEVYLVLGNNDSYATNYKIVPDGSFLHDISKIEEEMIAGSSNNHKLVKNLSRAGYYIVNPPHSRDLIIVLNTVLFSTHMNNQNAIAKQQLSWLDSQLTAAANKQQKVFLAFHIPMDADMHRTLRHLFTEIGPFWQDSYIAEFKKIIDQYPKVITAILPAHIHKDSFQLLELKHVHIPVAFTSSISPIYGNNPGFKVFVYDPATFKLHSSKTYILTYNNWHQEHEFDYDN